MERSQNRSRLIKRILRLGIILILGLLAIATVLAVFVGYPKFREFQKIVDSYDLAEIQAIPALSEVFDEEGNRYSRLSGEVRYVVPLSKITPLFYQAVIAREDSRFEQHHGIDLKGILRAAVSNVLAGKVEEGASTITQQLARNTFDLDENKWRRKIIEALLALKIEKQYTKDEIFEAYANRIYYGMGLYGVETASQACFGKNASAMSLSEAAILAGLIRSPNRLSPLEKSATAIRERDQVLTKMVELGFATQEQANEAKTEKMPLAKRLPPAIRDGYAMDAVIRDLNMVVAPEVIGRGGLRIYTSINRRLQMIAQDVLEKRLVEAESQEGWPHPSRSEAGPVPNSETSSPYVQGSLVVMDNQTGGILALVGGRDFASNPYNRAIQARRQIGSTFKPFVYAAAFERGLLPQTPIDDGPISEADFAGRKINWSPENSDGKYGGRLPASEGLIRSRNTMTVRVGEIAGLSEVRHLATQAGLGEIPDTPAIFLGAFETTLKDLVGTYTMFPNKGVRKHPYIIERIETRNGKLLYKATKTELKCLNPGPNAILHSLLREVMKTGTGASASRLGLTIEAAGKTGTTDDYRDAWFIGYTTRLTCGVWVGMDQPQRIANKAYGSALALPIWVDFMEEASKFRFLAEKFKKPDFRSVMICKVTKLLASPGCRFARQAIQTWIPKESLPTEICTTHKIRYARATPVEPSGAQESQPEAVPARPITSPSESEYRVIRKKDGFIFQSQ